MHKEMVCLQELDVSASQVLTKTGDWKSNLDYGWLMSSFFFSFLLNDENNCSSW